MDIFADLFAIASTAPLVIGKRMLAFAQGGVAAGVEGRRAVDEKVALAMMSTMSLATVGTVASVVRAYRDEVEANARRLQAKASSL